MNAKVKALSEQARKLTPEERIELLERDSAGVIPRVNLSVKVTALTLLLRPHAPDRGRAALAARLRELLRRARDVGAHLHIDADADLDEIVPAVLGPAFGFAGQKCPAASM